MNDRRNVVDMRVNSVSAQTADVLGDREHENMGMKVTNKNLPDQVGATEEERTIDTDSSGCCQ